MVAKVVTAASNSRCTVVPRELSSKKRSTRSIGVGMGVGVQSGAAVSADLFKGSLGSSGSSGWF